MSAFVILVCETVCDGPKSVCIPSSNELDYGITITTCIATTTAAAAAAAATTTTTITATTFQ